MKVCCSCGYAFDEKDAVPLNGLSGMPPGCPECGSDDLLEEEIDDEKIHRASEFCDKIKPYIEAHFGSKHVVSQNNDLDIRKMADEIHRIRINSLQLNQDSIDVIRIQESAEVLMDMIRPFLKELSNEELEKTGTEENTTK